MTPDPEDDKADDDSSTGIEPSFFPSVSAMAVSCLCDGRCPSSSMLIYVDIISRLKELSSPRQRPVFSVNVRVFIQSNEVRRNVRAVQMEKSGHCKKCG